MQMWKRVLIGTTAVATLGAGAGVAIAYSGAAPKDRPRVEHAAELQTEAVQAHPESFPRNMQESEKNLELKSGDKGSNDSPVSKDGASSKDSSVSTDRSVSKDAASSKDSSVSKDRSVSKDAASSKEKSGQDSQDHRDR